jgi:hypothetical protein
MSTLREDSTAENLIQIAQNYLGFQNLPISEPDPIPRRNFHKKSASGKATVRGFIGLEIWEKQIHAATTA